MRAIYISMSFLILFSFSMLALEELTALEMTSQEMKRIATWTVLVLPLPVVFMIFFTVKSLFKRCLCTTIPLVIFLSVILIGPTHIIFSSSVWKTVEVIENEDRLIVELQHRDMGALGIKKRAVLADSQFFGIFRISHSAE